MSLLPGTQLGSCEIVEQIGAGGMGEVYRGRDKKLGRDVAVKALPERFSRDPERLARFEREAQILAALSHPNLAIIHELKELQGETYLVLELVEGQTLAERISKGPVPLEDALDIARQIAEGMEAAHDKGVVHRDLKPANVKVTPEGRVKVLDFGLAKIYEATSTAQNVSNSPTLSALHTGAGVIMGTAAYMSPEQARGKTVDRRTDMWAFGCLLFEMLSGRQAFPNGETVSDTLAGILKGEPDWNALPGTTPPRIRVLLERCLRKDPRRRLPDAAAARMEIEEASSGPVAGVPPAPAAASRRPYLWPALTVASLLIAASLGAWILLAPKLDPEVVRFDVFAADGSQGNPALSPDGRMLAYVAGPGGKRQIWVRTLENADTKPLPGTEGVDRFVWSPDGQNLAFFSDGKVRRVAAGGGPVLEIVKEPRRDVAWGSKNVILIGGRSRELLRVSADSGESAPATQLMGKETTHDYPEFLPDGSHFLFLARRGGNPEDWAVYVGNLDSTERTLVPGIRSGVKYSSGYLVFNRDGGRTLMAHAFDADRLELKGTPFPVAETSPGPSPALFSLSRNGSLAYLGGVSGGESRPTWFNRKGVQTGFAGPAGEYRDLELSPDDNLIAFDRGTPPDVFILENGRTIATPLVAHDAADAVPIWSPDGGILVVLSSREPAGGSTAASNPNGGNLYQYIRAVGAVKELFKSAAGKVPTDWRHGYIAYVSQGDIWALKTPASDNSEPLRVTNTTFTERNARISPTGKWIAYDTIGTQSEVYVQAFPQPGTRYPVTINGGFLPRWNKDGSELFYLRLDPEPALMAVRIKEVGSELKFGVSEELFPVQFPAFSGFATGFIVPPGARSYAVASNGQFLVNVPIKEQAEPITVILNWAASLKSQ